MDVVMRRLRAAVPYVLALGQVSCGRILFDPSSDARAFEDSDSDGDGYADAVDNCPDAPNPTQTNEDSDRFGDACDPCPPHADADPVNDRDGDGVADACDPFADVVGDRIEVFEGFMAPPQTASAVGPWTFAAGQAAMNVTGTSAVLSWASPRTRSETVRGGVTIDTIAATTGVPRALGAVIQTRAAGDVGVYCGLAIGETNAPGLYISDVATLAILGFQAKAVSPEVSYLFSETRTGTSYTCTDSVGTISGTSTVAPAEPRIGVGGTNVSGRVQWVMIVSSP